MSNGQNPDPQSRLQQAVWPVGLLGVLYGVLLLARPDLFWYLLAGLVICLAFLAYYISSKDRSNQIEGKTPDDHHPSAVPYHLLVDALQFPVYLLDRNANVRYANYPTASTFGPVRVGDRISNRFRQPDLRKTIEKALEDEVAVTEDYNEPVPHDRWFQVEISPIRNASDQSKRHRRGYQQQFSSARRR